MMHPQEKRRHPRVEVPLRLKSLAYSSPKGGADGPSRWEVKVDNLSEGGVKFAGWSQGSPEPGDLLKVELDFGLLPRPLKATCRVQWAHAAQGDKACRVGAQFVELADQDRAILKNFIIQWPSHKPS